MKLVIDLTSWIIRATSLENPNSLKTNQPVQSLKNARSLKFQKLEIKPATPDLATPDLVALSLLS